MVPSTVQQLTILLIMILPGGVYQAVRERLLGPRPSEAQAESRVLRAVAASVLLDSVYALTAGPWLVSLLRDGGRAALLDRPRVTGATALLLVMVVPALVAYGESRWRERRSPSRQVTVPSAWDHLFAGRSSCFVRIRLKDGSWIAGWYGGRSLAASYPHGRDIFLQAQYAVLVDGTIGPRLAHTGGIYVPADSIDLLQLLEAAPDQQAAGPDEPRTPEPRTPEPDVSQGRTRT